MQKNRFDRVKCSLGATNIRFIYSIFKRKHKRRLDLYRRHNSSGGWHNIAGTVS